MGGKGVEGERSREGRGGAQGHLGSLDGRGADVKRAVPGRGRRQDHGRPRRVDGTKTRLGSWDQRLRACPGAKVPCQLASRVVPMSPPPSRQPPAECPQALRVTEALADGSGSRRGPAARRSRDSPHGHPPAEPASAAGAAGAGLPAAPRMLPRFQGDARHVNDVCLHGNEEVEKKENRAPKLQWSCVLWADGRGGDAAVASEKLQRPCGCNV